MRKRIPFEQLDVAVSALLARHDAPLPRVEPRLRPLVRLAADLRHLPRADFKSRLKEELTGREKMSTTATKPVREGFRTVTPYLVVKPLFQVLEFAKQAFGAEETFRSSTPGSGGGIHAEIRIGDTMLMIGGGEGLRHPPMPAALHYYVPNVDAVYERALAAGATSLYAPIDQEYGDREAGVRDPGGNCWFLATHKATGLRPPELTDVTPYLLARGAAQLIESLKHTLGAEELESYKDAQGTILHAKMRIGDSVVEMGEARGAFAPMPVMFMVYVDDVDGWFERARDAGAKVLFPPATQPYVHRVGAIEDSAGNQWYLAKPIPQAQP
jgi:uncharacterized glyoxalase superfamily protein PhnB